MIQEFNDISKNFLSQLQTIESNSSNILDCTNKSIALCRNTLHQFKSKILKSELNKTEEIEFFKNIKQIPLLPLIYYSEVRSFELQFPKADIESQKKFIKRKLVKLNRFFLNNIDFVQYINNENTHFDLHYFTREFLDSYHIVSSKFYFQDPDFTTARDMLLGKLKAYEKFIAYLQNRLTEYSKTKDYSIDASGQVDLQWTSTKTALTELIYALYHGRAINNGKTDIKVIATTLEKVLHFDVGDFYKTFADIKSRKISRTKFLDDLSAGLVSHMNNSEE